MTESENVETQEVQGNTQEQEQNDLNAVSNTIDEALSSDDTNKQDEKQNDQDKNWKAMREQHERLQREYETERKKREEYEQYVLKQMQNTQKPEQEKDEFEDIAPDDWLTKEQSQKLAQKMAKKAIEEALQLERQKRSEEELPTRIKTQFQDFDSVVNEENVKQLRALEPDVAFALSQIGDKYAQAVAAYKYIKKFIPEAAQQTEYRDRVNSNSSKPKSMSSVSSSNLSKASGFEKDLTPDMKKQLYAEMQAAIKGR